MNCVYVGLRADNKSCDCFASLIVGMKIRSDEIGLVAEALHTLFERNDASKKL